MNDETVNRALDMVAAGAGKLEAAVRDMAPHVWSAEVAYWRVQGIMALAFAVIVAGVALWWIPKVVRVHAERKSSKDFYTQISAGDVWFVPAMILALLGFIALACVAACGAAAFAPEMYAVRDLLKIIK